MKMNLLCSVIGVCTLLQIVHSRNLDFESEVADNKPAVVMDQSPWFCHGLDCPSFKQINKTKDFELRLYGESHWISTQLLNIDYDDASRTMFMRLFKYIDGKNEMKVKIAMTAPVIVEAVPGQGPACKQNFTMSFYLAPKEKNPPAALDKTIFFSTLPSMRVYVTSFGGYPDEADWVKKAAEFGETLKKLGKKFTSDPFHTAGYDSPFRVINRHNEIWFKALD